MHDARPRLAGEKQEVVLVQGPPVSHREARHRLDLAEPRPDLRPEPGVLSSEAR